MKQIFFILLAGLCLMSDAGAYTLAGGSRADAEAGIRLIQAYYTASQKEDIETYTGLFLAPDTASLGRRAATAKQIWSMFDLVSFSLDIQEVAISSGGETALIRYVAKTTLSDAGGSQKSTSNEFMALLFKLDQNWYIGDINLASGFQSLMDDLLEGATHMAFNQSPPSLEPLGAPAHLVEGRAAGEPEPGPAAARKPPETAAPSPAASQGYKDPETGARFRLPQGMVMSQKGSELILHNESGSAFITYEALPDAKHGGQYQNSKDFRARLARHVQKNLGAQIKETGTRIAVDKLKGSRLDFKWEKDGYRLEQIKVALDGDTRIYTFGLMAKAKVFPQYLQVFEELLMSFKPGIAGQTTQKEILHLTPDTDGVEGVLTEKLISVAFTAEKDTKHVIICDTILAAPVIMILYDADGNKLDTNAKKGQLFKGFKEVLEKGKTYYFVIRSYKNKDVGKPFKVRVYTE